MADQITIRNESKAPVPEGQYLAVCVDVIDLGERVEQYQQNPPEVQHKVALVFQLAENDPDTGRPYEISVENTLSFGKKSNLRKLLEDWRGKAYTMDEAAAGIPLHKLEGANGFLSVEHKTAASGNVYARVRTITPAPKDYRKLAARDYERPEYWTKRREEYAAGVAKHRADIRARSANVAQMLRAAESSAPPAHAAIAPAVGDDGLPF